MSLLPYRHAQPTWSGLPERSRMKRCMRPTSVLRHPKEEAMVLSSTCKMGKGEVLHFLSSCRPDAQLAQGLLKGLPL